jgi:hypothetical protein
VDSLELEKVAVPVGLILVEKRIVTLDSGKSFAVLRMKKESQKAETN